MKLFNRANVLVVLAMVMFTLGVWAYLNRPEWEPSWPKIIQGFSFSPIRENQDPLQNIFPSELEIEEDIKLLSGKTHAIRTYSMEDAYVKIPEMAKKYNINVALGAWIDTRTGNNTQEVERLIHSAVTNPNIVRLIVGNEALLRGDVTVEELAVFLDRVRTEVDLPVSTAEPWHVWIKHPELVDHVDYLAVHMLPYWEGIDLDIAVEYIVQHMNSLMALFPDKPVVITEVGWPSEGRTRGSSVASSSSQAIFLRRFLDRAEQEKYIYYVMEAFDQPWKKVSEGAVGAYWGVYNVYRQPKIPFTEPIVAIQNWYILAGVSILLAILLLSFLLVDSNTLKIRGRSFLGVVVFGLATIVVWIFYDYSHQYLTIKSVIVGVFMMLGMIGVVSVLMIEAHEWAEAIWVKHRRRDILPVYVPDEQLPMVSIHVATYNEPPDMVIETLKALHALRYPRFEVLIIDNNTKDESVWKPVEEFCKTLPSYFRFFHVDPISGFKAGALNHVLKFTSPQAEVVGVIDSDYKVDPNWLIDLVPQFVNNEKVAIVQAPQDYRDGQDSLFKKMCYAEYEGFFYIGMITRNERNAIIQHGTMTLVRKKDLEEVGGWGEWCITEDTELGLRIFENKKEALYTSRSYGQGLMPDSFVDFKKQRYRWAYGAVQILKKHFKILINFRDRRLTFGQRYHFLTGWFPWFSDAVNVLFNFAAIFWSFAMIVFPKKIDPPLVEFSLLPLALFSFKMGKLIFLYRQRIRASFFEICGAAIAGLSLSYTISRAVLQGLFTSDLPFFRTPKQAGKNPLFKALFYVREELLFLIVMLLLEYALISQYYHSVMMLDMTLWFVVLFVQAIPYAMSVLFALISGAQRQKK